jgi:hypothetical protein
MGKTTGPVFAADRDLRPDAPASARTAPPADLAPSHGPGAMVKLKLNMFNETAGSS